eukprot:TRINITY_DN154_c0_g3_i2.p1 TRINITY_DN154_c0_g3~~TRINITY_DN154_c0_g3_i2.p1  ORF type:complete len:400 (+),score=151.93 TRINITY_DN154_c0_g3_i2:45-1244(+)
MQHDFAPSLGMLAVLVEQLHKEGEGKYAGRLSPLTTAGGRVQDLMSQVEAVLGELQEKVKMYYENHIPEEKRSQVRKHVENLRDTVEKVAERLREATGDLGKNGKHTAGQVAKKADEVAVMLAKWTTTVQSTVADLSKTHVEPTLTTAKEQLCTAKEQLNHYSPSSYEKADSAFIALFDSSLSYPQRIITFVALFIEALYVLFTAVWEGKKAEKSSAVKTTPATPEAAAPSPKAEAPVTPTPVKAEPAVEATPEPLAAPEHVVEATPEPVVAAPEPAEATPKPVVEATPEPVEATPEPVVEATPEPVVATPEPVEATPEPVVEATPEPVTELPMPSPIKETPEPVTPSPARETPEPINGSIDLNKENVKKATNVLSDITSAPVKPTHTKRSHRKQQNRN